MPDQAIAPEQVRDVARLARLALDDAELARLRSQLGAILKYVDQISEIDVANVEPMAHALPISNVLRDDVIGPSPSVEQVLQNAPETDGPFFKVPKVIGGEDSAG